jgi:hypothetical protein
VLLIDGEEVIATVGFDVSLATVVEACTALLPAESLMSAVRATEPPSETAVTLTVADQALAVHVPDPLTPPAVTDTVLVFSEHVPLKVYVALLALLITGLEVIATVGMMVSFRTVVLACGALLPAPSS